MAADGHRRLAGRAGVRRERRSPCSRPAPRRRNIRDAIERADGLRRHDRAGARLPGPALPSAARRRRRCARGRRLVAAAGAAGPRAGDVRIGRRTSARPPRSRSSISQATRRRRKRRSRCRPARRSARSPSIAIPARCAWPASAPARKARSRSSGPEVPQLRFIESKCVQCGLCAATCPEDAIALAPRLSLVAEAKQPRVLNEAVDIQVHRAAASRSAPRR